MIAKQIKGRSFRRVLNYLDEKAGAKRIGGNMVGKTLPQLTAEFACSQQLNPALQRAVYHASLAVPREEAQTEQSWNAIAKDYLQGMDFRGCQYVVYRHTDTEHDHIHMVASRTRFTDGTTVSDSWDYKRSEALVRELERTYNLKPVEPNEPGVRSQTTGEMRQLQRTGEASVREQLKPILAEASADSPGMPEYIRRVLAAGVEVKVSPGSAGIRGISYALDGVAFSGTHLGRDYTFPGLQKHRGIAYEPAQDDERIDALIKQGPQLRRGDDSAPVTTPLPIETSRPVTLADNRELAGQTEATVMDEVAPAFPKPQSALSTELNPLQRRGAEAISPVAISLLTLMQRQGAVEQVDADRWQYQGQHYAMTYDRGNGTFSVRALDGRGELFRIRQGAGGDVVEMAEGINRADLERFEQMARLLVRQQAIARRQDNLERL